MEKKVIYEVRLSKSLMTVAVIAAIGLLAIGAKPFIETNKAFAQSNEVHKIAICSPNEPEICVGVGVHKKKGRLLIGHIIK